MSSRRYELKSEVPKEFSAEKMIEEYDMKDANTWSSVNRVNMVGQSLHGLHPPLIRWSLENVAPLVLVKAVVVIVQPDRTKIINQHTIKDRPHKDNVLQFGSTAIPSDDESLFSSTDERKQIVREVGENRFEAGPLDRQTEGDISDRTTTQKISNYYHDRNRLSGRNTIEHERAICRDDRDPPRASLFRSSSNAEAVSHQNQTFSGERNLASTWPHDPQSRQYCKISYSSLQRRP